MPWKLKHPCAWQGCPALVEPGEQYCKKHKRIADKLYSEKRENRQYWSRWEWRKIRQEHLKKYPFCAICGSKAREVDHIIPVAQGGTDNDDNLQSLCKSCHSKKTAREGRWGKKGRGV